MSSRKLDISINQQLVGQLREQDDLWEFEYSPAWLAAENGFDLSPALARSTALHRDGSSNRPVQWYFDNLLPEEALRTILAKEADVAEADAFALLGLFGSESAGSLVLAYTGSDAQPERGLRPLPYPELSRRIANLPRASLTKDAPKKMSLAGAQHKMLVAVVGNDLYEPLPGTPSTHILKPAHQGADYPASVMNEYFTMRLAKAVGLNAPQVRRLYVPEPVYIVERFDRIQIGGPQDVQRRHVIDTCQLLNKARTFKYSAADIGSLAQAATLCRSRVAARMSLYRWVLFNALIGNGDNHLKNISFLVDAAGIKVAPSYDLLCTAVYETRAMADERARWPQTGLALSIGAATTFAALTRNDVLEAGKRLGLAVNTAERELDTMIKRIGEEADKLIAEIKASNDAVEPEHRANRDSLSASEARLLDAIRHVVLQEMISKFST